MSEPVDYKKSFSSLADRFIDLAEALDAAHSRKPMATPSAEESTRPGQWVPVNFDADLLKRKAIRDQIKEYRNLVAQAGEILLSACHSQLLDVAGLEPAVAAYELSELGPIPCKPANLFALWAGGSRFELWMSNGDVEEFEKPGVGWPFQFRRAERLKTVSGVLRASGFEGIESPPDAAQCRHYGEVCRQLSAAASKQRGVPERAIKAAEQYRKAAQALGNVAPTDDEAYDLLQGLYHEQPRAVQELGDLAARENWKRYLRDYRRANDEQKHTSRRGRANGGRSIQRQSEL